jgi:hypothetical protein
VAWRGPVEDGWILGPGDLQCPQARGRCPGQRIESVDIYIDINKHASDGR